MDTKIRFKKDILGSKYVAKNLEQKSMYSSISR